MKRRSFLQYTLAAGLSTIVAPLESKAFIVFDPSNFAQSVIQAIRLLQSNINEARMIANQVISIANEAKNLTKLPFDIIQDFSSQFSNLFETTGSINGLMQNLSSLQAQFEELYPNFLEMYDPVSRSSMADDAQRWVQTTRDMILGVSKTGAQVLQSLPTTQSQLERLMADSQGAVGILQATQAGNQIAATISGNLINLNAQLATYTQAHTAFLMEWNGAEGAAKNRMDHVLDGIDTPYAGKSLPENPF